MSCCSSVEVGREAARELAGAPLGEERGREPHDVREQLAPERGQHALGGAAQQLHLHERAHALQREHPEQPERQPVELAAVAVDEGGVQELAHHGREGEPGTAATTRHTSATASRPA
jgi:hypothetical protein